MGGIIRWLADAMSAQADARHLRELYGDQAETWCAGALGALPPGDPRRRSILLIAKVLRGLPPAEPIQAPSSHRRLPVQSGAQLTASAGGSAHGGNPVAGR